MNKIEELSKFGAVRTCKEIKNSVVTIVMTDGFSEEMGRTFAFLKKSQELFPEYPNVETMITEENFAILVLTK